MRGLELLVFGFWFWGFEGSDFLLSLLVAAARISPFSSSSLTSSISFRISARSSRRALDAFQVAPSLVRSSLTRPPIHPVPPKRRKRGGCFGFGVVVFFGVSILESERRERGAEGSRSRRERASELFSPPSFVLTKKPNKMRSCFALLLSAREPQRLHRRTLCPSRPARRGEKQKRGNEAVKNARGKTTMSSSGARGKKIDHAWQKRFPILLAPHSLSSAFTRI